MSDIKLFRIASGAVTELAGTTDTVEKSVQVLFEKNLEALLGVRFLATEYTTTHGGRIDTLGLDENGCPVILEYKRASNENVINQGLFYLDWLMDHRKDFQWLVMEKLGKVAADGVDWSAPRLICIALASVPVPAGSASSWNGSAFSSATAISRSESLRLAFAPRRMVGPPPSLSSLVLRLSMLYLRINL